MISFAFKTVNGSFLVTQTSIANNIMKIKDSNDEVINLNNNLINFVGHYGDITHLKPFILTKLNYFSIELNESISINMIQQTIKNKIYENIRNKNPYQVNTLIVNANKISLIDSYGAINTDDFLVTNYGIYFLFGIFDSYHSKLMTIEESYKFINLCIKALKEKIILETDKWRIDFIGHEANSTEYISL